LKVNGFEDQPTGPNLDELQTGFIELVLSFKYLMRYSIGDVILRLRSHYD